MSEHTRVDINQPVSFLVPAYNAESLIKKVIQAIALQDYPGKIEIIVVNDGSTDRTSQEARSMQSVMPAGRRLIVIDQGNSGAASATNRAIDAASYDIICSVDSDVILHRDWLKKIIPEFSDPKVAAVQGYYKTPNGVSFWAKVMGYDAEARYDEIPSKYVTHVCTGNTAYRKEVLQKVGLFDTSFVYGYDNDMSYRLLKAGYKLVFVKDALCDHYWKSSFWGYIKQQFRAGYGRLKLLEKHPERLKGDSFSGLRMMLQVPLTFTILFLYILLALLSTKNMIPYQMLYIPTFLIVLLLIERYQFAFKVFQKQKDIVAFFIPPVHLLRNISWCAAVVMWFLKRSLKGKEQ